MNRNKIHNISNDVQMSRRRFDVQHEPFLDQPARNMEERGRGVIYCLAREQWLLHLYGNKFGINGYGCADIR